MVEIARAFSVTDAPARLVILDEPTSSLDAHTAGQLLMHVRRSVASGVSCVLISHILGEVLSTCDRIVVMRDGKVVMADVASNFDRDEAGRRHGRHRVAKRPARKARPRRRRAAELRSSFACAPSGRPTSGK